MPFQPWSPCNLGQAVLLSRGAHLPSGLHTQAGSPGPQLPPEHAAYRSHLRPRPAGLRLPEYAVAASGSKLISAGGNRSLDRIDTPRNYERSRIKFTGVGGPETRETRHSRQNRSLITAAKHAGGAETLLNYSLGSSDQRVEQSLFCGRDPVG